MVIGYLGWVNKGFLSINRYHCVFVSNILFTFGILLAIIKRLMLKIAA